MPRWNIANKLNPAKKAWKSYETKLRPKLMNFLRHSVPTAAKATSRRLPLSFASFLPSKLRSISNPSRKNCHKYNPFQRNSSYFMNHHQVKPGFATVHVDELFSRRGVVSVKSKSRRNDVVGTSQRDHAGHERPVIESEWYGVEDVWKTAVGVSPPLRSVDERAEEFIEKMRQDMKLQKESRRDIVSVKSKSSKNAVVGTSRRDRDGRERPVITSELYSVEDAWKIAVGLYPQPRSVDERAEEFIKKMRQNLKLQKEKSILEFQEVLARGC